MCKHNLNINYATKLLRAMITRNDIDRAHRHSGKITVDHFFKHFSKKICFKFPSSKIKKNK